MSELSNEPCCNYCGYILKGVASPKCPECGRVNSLRWTFGQYTVARRRRRRLELAAILGVVAAVGSGALVVRGITAVDTVDLCTKCAAISRCRVYYVFGLPVVTHRGEAHPTRLGEVLAARPVAHLHEWIRVKTYNVNARGRGGQASRAQATTRLTLISISTETTDLTPLLDLAVPRDWLCAMIRKEILEEQDDVTASARYSILCHTARRPETWSRRRNIWSNPPSSRKEGEGLPGAR
jgi:hypothetical protein